MHATHTPVSMSACHHSSNLIRGRNKDWKIMGTSYLFFSRMQRKIKLLKKKSILSSTEQIWVIMFLFLAAKIILQSYTSCGDSDPSNATQVKPQVNPIPSNMACLSACLPVHLAARLSICCLAMFDSLPENHNKKKWTNCKTGKPTQLVAGLLPLRYNVYFDRI